MNYGKRTNAEIRLHNGFVPFEENPNNTIKLSLSVANTI